LQFHRAPTSSNWGVLLIIGGAYEKITPDGRQKDGDDPAAFLTACGYNAWVLHSYPCAQNSKTPLGSAPQECVRNAINTIKSGHPEIRLGVWGWSSGGHLATTIDVPVEFTILAYPVISMKHDIAHERSLHNLLGLQATDDERSSMSAENHVTAQTSITYMYHTWEDDQVLVEHTFRYANALASQNRPFKLVIVPEGKHG
ncbi:hypothetical protein BKA67DRAFT_503802, partial [Truncatella angustata]